MTRKIVLTPYEHGGFAALHTIFNEALNNEKTDLIDMQHLLLSSVIMAGVDKIYSGDNFGNTSTKLIKKITSKVSSDKYSICFNKVDETLKNYIPDSNERTKLYASHVISHLLYCMQTNSAALFLFGIDNRLKQDKLPSELLIPLKILLSSIQSKSAQLPILKGDIEKKEVKKLIDVLDSKEFSFYKEAQGEIENDFKLTGNTITKIEKAGKDLFRNNGNLFLLKNNVIKAVPITAKLIDLFFGKLPGILSNYAGTIAVDYLNDSKTIPIYNCEEIIQEELIKRIKSYTRSLCD